MLESVDHRDITLLDVARTCGQESARLNQPGYRALAGRSLSMPVRLAVEQRHSRALQKFVIFGAIAPETVLFVLTHWKKN